MKRKFLFNCNIKKLFIVFALFPAISHLLIFWFGIQLETLIMGFTDYDTNDFTLQNFSYVFSALANSKEPLGEGIVNTMIFFLVGLLTIPFNIFAAYMIYKKMAFHKFVRVCLYLPGAISSFMMAILYQQLLGSDGFVVYLLNDILKLNITTPLLMEHALSVIIVFDIWIGLGSSIIIWFGAMGKIPDDVLEYGSLDGIGAVKEFIYIIMPLLWSTFVTMVTLQLVGIFGATGSVFIFTEGKFGTYTISYWMYHLVYDGAENMYNKAVAAGLLFTGITIPLVFIGRLILNKFGGKLDY